MGWGGGICYLHHILVVPYMTLICQQVFELFGVKHIGMLGQDKKCTYNVILRPIRLTIVAMETQQYFPSVLLLTYI